MRHLLAVLYKYGEIVKKSNTIFLSCFFLRNIVMEHTVRVHSTHLQAQLVQANTTCTSYFIQDQAAQIGTT